jgi:hypothetical protein
MARNGRNEFAEIDQAIRINERKAEVEELAGGAMDGFERPDCPPDIAEQFWQHMAAYEKAPHTSHFQLLIDRGIALPPAEELSDRQLHAKLWEVIHELAKMQTYLLSTNHYSDRELYDQLLSDTLHEDMVDGLPGMTCVIDLVSSGSEEDIENYLRYYADAESRRHWRQSFPNGKLPKRQKPPYDRDRLLPKG